VDSSELILIQRQMLTKKKVLRTVFEDMYNFLLKKEVPKMFRLPIRNTKTVLLVEARLV